MLPMMVALPVKALSARRVSWATPVLTKFRLPLIEPAKSRAELVVVKKFTAPLPAGLVMIPPEPTSVPRLRRSPIVCDLPLRSRVEPELETSAFAF